MPSFVYVLATQNPDGRIVTYVGWTLDLERRLAEHNASAWPQRRAHDARPGLGADLCREMAHPPQGDVAGGAAQARPRLPRPAARQGL